MIKVENNVAYIEGTSKTICKEFTHLIIQLLNTLEKDFELSQEDAINVINQCAKIAYMNDEDRAKFLSNLGGE